MIALTRLNDVFGQLDVVLIKKEEEAEVSEAETIVDTRVVTPAEFPMTATTPKAALLTGLFLGAFRRDWAGAGAACGLRPGA